jgi:pimeloyl-ACP methyl ester carboxylesterase
MANQVAPLMPLQQSMITPPDSSKVGKIRRPDGRTVAYEIDGPRSEKTLVYLHGMTQGRHWPEKARRLAKSRGWQVVRISRAGRGQSSVNIKENKELLQDHVDDVMAILDREEIRTFSIFGAADGFAVGYPIALQHPERVKMIIGLEVVPPILSRKVISGFSGKMKTFGLACLYAPKSVKFMLGLAMRQLEQMEDRYSGVHPLLGVELGKFEDADGIQADDRNFQDLIVHKADGMWRDASYSAFDWAFAAENSNLRPRAALIHCDNSLIKSQGHLDNFAQRIGAPIYRLESYFPYVSACLPLVLDTLDPI